MPEKLKQNHRIERTWMGISLGVAVLLLVLKFAAFSITDSTAILSDVIESIVHLVAVIFAFYSVRISQRPPDKDHPYGHAKISFFSSAFEGAMISFAALFIAWRAILEFQEPTTIQHLDKGIAFSLVVLLSNLLLGLLLWRVSIKIHSIILRANGFHVLTDAWTSVGVWVALLLVQFTGWQYWDPLVGIIIAINILVTGTKLMANGFNGLMDRADPSVGEKLQHTLEEECNKKGVQYHRLKFRDIGGTLDVDVDLLFPDEMPIKKAHEIATQIEKSMANTIHGKAIISTHLEPIRHHQDIHPNSK